MPWSRLAKMPREMVKPLSGCWCWALDLHVLVSGGVDADVTLLEIVAWKCVHLRVFMKMRKISCRTWWGLWSPPFELASWRRWSCSWHRTRRCCCRPKMKCLAYPSQDSSKYEWKNGENYTKCTLTDVKNGSMITQWCNKEIAQLVPILVGFSHLHK